MAAVILTANLGILAAMASAVALQVRVRAKRADTNRAFAPVVDRAVDLRLLSEAAQIAFDGDAYGPARTPSAPAP
jgi:hypothetical protein